MTQKENAQKRRIRMRENITRSPLADLKDSVREYHEPFEPVQVEDWEALGLKDLEDDTITPRSGA